MAVSAKWYTNGPKHCVNGDVTWPTADIRVALCTSSYSPNQDTHDVFGDVSANELSAGNGYTAFGVALTSQTVAVDTGTNETRLQGDATTAWTSATFSARYAIVYAYNATAGLRYLLGYVDFGVDESPVAGTFTITWASDGILKITAGT